MTYDEATEFLFSQLAMFQNVGADAYKPGLTTVTALSDAFGSPHEGMRCIHIGGTNGKGSTAHTLAAVLQSAGYKVGLFTSPHLVDFRERIRVDGRMISQEEVVDFVTRYLTVAHALPRPSFFELTTVMAFEYFRRCNVDIAVIEVGLGGRLDSTNIITPLLSVITNISLDHTALLGHTPAEIAAEKAGIIKAGIPVVIGEADDHDVADVFVTKAEQVGAPIVFADRTRMFDSCDREGDFIVYTHTPFGTIRGQLTGDCQVKNAATILCSLAVLRDLGLQITNEAVSQGFEHVCDLTGLAGRWMTVSHNPTVICDTGHNVGGWQYLAPKLAAFGRKLHMVIGFVNDKDISTILSMMPREAHYHFVKPSVDRGLDAASLAAKAVEVGIVGSVDGCVADGYKIALSEVEKGDVIFVGGSTFVVADLLTFIA